MKTLVEVFVIAALAYGIAEYQAPGAPWLGNFYATMVLASVFYAIRSGCFIFAGMMFFMVCGYAIDEITDWQHPYLVINSNIVLGVIIYNWCTAKGTDANKYIAGIFICKAFWGGAYVYSGLIPIGIYAMILNFMSIIEWVWFANMSIDRRKYLEFHPQEGIESFYLKTPWTTQKK